MLTTLFSKLDQALQGGIDHLLVALSGGLDSTALLHACCQYRLKHPTIRLTATHIHHGLSHNADDWAQHCQDLCKQWRVPIELINVVVPKGARMSLEASAREQRYQALHQSLGQHSLLLTAHHRDDQVETLLLALKRGSGLDGLSAMPEFMKLKCGYHARPLLAVSRIELEAYGQQHKLSWIEDESNQDQSYDRNFIRHSLLPLLQQRWPGFDKTAARSVELLAAQRQILDELAEQDRQACQKKECLSISALKTLSVGRREQVLRAWLRQQGAPLWSQAQLLEAWYSVALAREDAQPMLQWQRWTLRRYQGLLSLQLPQSELILADLNWDWPRPMELSRDLGVLWAQRETTVGTERLREPRNDEQVTVRFGCRGSLKVHPSGRLGSRGLKKVWQEHKVAPWLRPQVPMVFYNDRLVAAVGYWIEKGFVQNEGEGWLPAIRGMESD